MVMANELNTHGMNIGATVGDMAPMILNTSANMLPRTPSLSVPRTVNKIHQTEMPSLFFRY